MASAQSKPHSRSAASSWFSSCSSPALPPLDCRSGVSMARAKQLGWPHAATVRNSLRRGRSRRSERPWRSAVTAATSWCESARAHPSCPESSSSAKPSPRLSNGSDDRGSATVLAAAMVAVLGTVAIGGVHVGATVLARHRAQSAADLAALAAARRGPSGEAAACREAGVLAAAMHGRLQECSLEQLDAIVTVTVDVGGLVGARARAIARAGPGAPG